MKLRWIIFLLFSVYGFALAVEWNVDLQAKNEVKFISRAETFIKTFRFEGITDKIDGYLYWKDDSLFSENELYFEIDLNSFDTGIKKRNQDMRKMILETERWPTASYSGKIIRFEKVDTSITVYRVVAMGELTLHGVTKSIEIPGIVQVQDGNIRVKANFSLLLTDYGMKIPSILVAKVANRIEIRVTVYLQKVAE